MTQYCKIGDKPKVFFKFPGEQSNTTFEPNVAPVDINITTKTSDT